MAYKHANRWLHEAYNELKNDVAGRHLSVIELMIDYNQTEIFTNHKLL